MEQTPDKRVGAPMRRFNPTTIALLGGLLALLLLIVLLTGRNKSEQDRLGDDQLNQTAAAVDPEKKCSSQRTYDLIKRELFRQAARVRAADQAAFDKLSAYSALRMDAPMLRSHDKEIGTVSCSGTLALDLPPGVAVVGGRRTLTAEINYSIQPAADGSGEVLTLSNADGIITPLATLARVGAPAETGLTAEDPQAIDQNIAASESANKEIGPQTVYPGRPSFDCNQASTRGELAVCGDTGLSALDVNMATQYRRAIASANPEQRALLARTRDRFLSFRDSCSNSGCMRDAYMGRMREIRDIMEGRWRAPR